MRKLELLDFASLFAPEQGSIEKKITTTSVLYGCIGVGIGFVVTMVEPLFSA